MSLLLIASRWTRCGGWLVSAVLLASPALAEESNAMRTAGRVAGVVSPVSASSETVIELAAEPSDARLSYEHDLAFDWVAADDPSFALNPEAHSPQFASPSVVVSPSPGGNLNLLPGEPAQEILELIERAGGSVLEGTLFNVPGSNESFADNREARRATIVETVRQLQSEDEGRLTAAAPQSWMPQPKSVSPSPAVDVNRNAAAEQRNSIEELRKACEQLELAAGALERQELYDYADRIRATAQEMRLEARRLTRGQPAHESAQCNEMAVAPAVSVQEVQPLRLTPLAAWPAAVGYRTRRVESIDPRDNEIRALKKQLEALEEQLQTRPAATPISVPLRYPLAPQNEHSSSMFNPPTPQAEIMFGVEPNSTTGVLFGLQQAD